MIPVERPFRARREGDNHGRAGLAKPLWVEPDLVHRIAERVEVAEYPIVASVDVGLKTRAQALQRSNSGCTVARMRSMSPLLKAAVTHRTISRLCCDMIYFQNAGIGDSVRSVENVPPCAGLDEQERGHFRLPHRAGR